jgi:hypothetical protein
MNIDAKDILIPFLTASLASYLTHKLTFKRTRAELLVRERASAFAELHQKLVEILRYCRARTGEESGSDFAETTETLTESENQSPLEHLHSFRAVIDKNFIYYPEKLQKRFPAFEERIFLMCGHELRCAADPHAPTQLTGSYYESLMELTIRMIKEVDRHSPLR